MNNKNKRRDIMVMVEEEDRTCNVSSNDFYDLYVDALKLNIK